MAKEPKKGGRELARKRSIYRQPTCGFREHPLSAIVYAVVTIAWLRTRWSLCRSYFYWACRLSPSNPMRGVGLLSHVNIVHHATPLITPARVRGRPLLLFASCVSSTLFRTCSDPWPKGHMRDFNLNLVKSSPLWRI